MFVYWELKKKVSFKLGHRTSRFPNSIQFSEMKLKQGSEVKSPFGRGIHFGSLKSMVRLQVKFHGSLLAFQTKLYVHTLSTASLVLAFHVFLITNLSPGVQGQCQELRGRGKRLRKRFLWTTRSTQESLVAILQQSSCTGVQSVQPQVLRDLWE